MGLTQDIYNQPVSALPVTKPVTLAGSVSTREAIRRMLDERQGCVIVVDENGRAEGKFTEHQLARLLVERPGFLDEPVGQHIREYWAQIRHNEPIASVIHKLQTYRQRHVIVVDDEGVVTGVVGQKGLMEYLTEQFPRLVKVQMMGTRVAMDSREGA